MVESPCHIPSDKSLFKDVTKPKPKKNLIIVIHDRTIKILTSWELMLKMSPHGHADCTSKSLVKFKSNKSNNHSQSLSTFSSSLADALCSITAIYFLH